MIYLRILLWCSNFSPEIPRKCCFVNCFPMRKIAILFNLFSYWNLNDLERQHVKECSSQLQDEINKE
ncbi:Protein of unknown function, partial [Gryllus bimaculatus]